MQLACQANSLDAAAQRQEVLRIVGGQPAPLFALLDAARDRAVLKLLRRRGEQFQSLYDGKQGKELADFAPHLIGLDPRGAFLEELLAAGWGQSWGIFLTSGAAFNEVRRHFRRFLLIKTEDGKEYYFRFYDPRVLSVYIPTCTIEELTEFFGPIRSFIAEVREPAGVIEFSNTNKGFFTRTYALAEAQ
ncbi:MAG TPA: DUF4123 domain-containing protein [Tepidisphaeraceae bacterium]|nr:DUF4123 domain-containing protein [Tepidisphaeraceae bacterium]